MKRILNKGKRPAQFWIICVLLLMLLYTISCFYVIDRYADTDPAKVLPAEKLIRSDESNPPEISITVDDEEIDYLLEKANWAGEAMSISDEDVIDQLKKNKISIPTIYIGSLRDMQHKFIAVEFKNHTLPDEIHLYDTLISGFSIIKDPAYTETLIETVNDHQIKLPLGHHSSVMLSSNMHDYEKSYQRLFRLICTWGEETCHYIFVINTSSTLTSNVSLLQ